MMGLGANFIMKGVASSANSYGNMVIVTMISIRTYSVLKTHSFYR